MKHVKSPPELVEHFGRILARFPEVERRQMFGYPAAFVGGNMVTGLHEARWVVRLGAMKAFAALPDSVLDDDEELTRWVERAIRHGRSMPTKK
jgi:TfoX/Sxy family transcriptional regulator of competence genes